jgi:hypothetical protein
MNLPWGHTFSFQCTAEQSLTFWKGDLVYLMGEGRATDPRLDIYDNLPLAAAKVAGTGTITDTGSRFIYVATGGVGTDTMTVTLAHTVTSEIHTFTMVIDVAAGITEVNPRYVIQNPVPIDYKTPCSTDSVTDWLDFKTPTRSDDPGIVPFQTYEPLQSGIGKYLDFGSTTGTNLYATDLPPSVWEKADTSTHYFAATCGYIVDVPPPTPTEVGVGYFYYYYPVGPVVNKFSPSPSSTVSEAYDAVAMSTALNLCQTVSTVQPRQGPLGVWKSASMNGRAYWFNGYSGTSFWMDTDDPTSTGDIGKARPDASGITLTTFIKGAGEKTFYPKMQTRYWFAEIDEDGLESGLADDHHDFNNTSYTIKGIEIQDIPPATNSLSHWIIYRSLSKAKDPYFLKGLPKGHSTESWQDYKVDDDLGDPPWIHGDRPPWDAFSPVVYYDRLWCLGTRPGVEGAIRTTLFWSDINEPESFWWDGNWANVYADDGDEVTALVRDKTGLLVFKNNHLYLMTGRTPDEISFNELTVEDSDTGVGSPHPNAIVATDMGVFFYWNRGIYRYMGGQVIKISKRISPILEGYDAHFPSELDIQWPYYGKPDDWSTQLSYDPVSQVIYIGMRGVFPNIESMPDDYFEFIYPDVIYDPNPNSLFNPGVTNELTLLLDAANARWIGMYTFDFGFFRRAKLTLYDQWHTRSTRTSTQGSSLIAGYLGGHSEFLGFHEKHPVMAVPSTGLMNTVPIWHMVKFRPISGNLGPYSSKRFIALDYLMDDDGAVFNSASSQVESNAYLDADASVTSTVSLTVQGGAIYSTRIRHQLGLVGSEIESQLYFDKARLGGVIRLFEYGVAWQNMGREVAERPGAAPASPKGGPALTGPPVKLG